MNKISNEILNVCAQSWINSYKGRHGKVKKIFTSETFHYDGQCDWIEGYRRGVLYIVFEGTHNKTGWRHDFQYFQMPFTVLRSGIQVHRGLYRGEYLPISGDIVATVKKHNGPIVITGHSLGGAVAILCAAHIKTFFPDKDISCVFTGPRVGDTTFKKDYKALAIPTVGFIYKNDPVPHVPPRVIFGKKAGGKFWQFIRYRHVYRLTRLGKRSLADWWRYFTDKSFIGGDHEPVHYLQEIAKKFPVSGGVVSKKDCDLGHLTP